MPYFNEIIRLAIKKDYNSLSYIEHNADFDIDELSPQLVLFKTVDAKPHSAHCTPAAYLIATDEIAAAQYLIEYHYACPYKARQVYDICKKPLSSSEHLSSPSNLVETPTVLENNLEFKLSQNKAFIAVSDQKTKKCIFTAKGKHFHSAALSNERLVFIDDYSQNSRHRLPIQERDNVSNKTSNLLLHYFDFKAGKYIQSIIKIDKNRKIQKIQCINDKYFILQYAINYCEIWKIDPCEHLKTVLLDCDDMDEYNFNQILQFSLESKSSEFRRSFDLSTLAFDLQQFRKSSLDISPFVEEKNLNLTTEIRRSIRKFKILDSIEDIYEKHINEAFLYLLHNQRETGIEITSYEGQQSSFIRVRLSKYNDEIGNYLLRIPSLTACFELDEDKSNLLREIERDMTRKTEEGKKHFLRIYPARVGAYIDKLLEHTIIGPIIKARQNSIESLYGDKLKYYEALFFSEMSFHEELSNALTLNFDLEEKQTNQPVSPRWRYENANKSLTQIISIFREVSQALETLHESRYVHLDLNPGNILFSLDENDQVTLVKLIDFGKAKKMDLAGKIPAEMTSRNLSSPQLLACNANKDKTSAIAEDKFQLATLLFEVITESRVPNIASILKKKNIRITTTEPDAVKRYYEQYSDELLKIMHEMYHKTKLNLIKLYRQDEYLIDSAWKLIENIINANNSDRERLSLLNSGFLTYREEFKDELHPSQILSEQLDRPSCSEIKEHISSLIKISHKDEKPDDLDTSPETVTTMLRNLLTDKEQGQLRSMREVALGNYGPYAQVNIPLKKYFNCISLFKLTCLEHKQDLPISNIFTIVSTLKSSSPDSKQNKSLLDGFSALSLRYYSDYFKDVIGDHGAEILSESLKVNTSLIVLDLKKQNIGSEGARFIADALKKNNTLKALDLGGNNIDTVAAQCLANALTHNKNLLEINLEQNRIGLQAMRIFNEALKKGKIVARVILNNNKSEEDKNIRHFRLNLDKITKEKKHSDSIKNKDVIRGCHYLDYARKIRQVTNNLLIPNVITDIINEYLGDLRALSADEINLFFESGHTSSMLTPDTLLSPLQNYVSDHRFFKRHQPEALKLVNLLKEKLTAYIVSLYTPHDGKEIMQSIKKAIKLAGITVNAQGETPKPQGHYKCALDQTLANINNQFT